ncbi:gastrula zinc finger protein xFG20-1 [Eurytemora carolleeae]|uniref:gastrula zinc finger protein xFG20-1 n=1 Tax=Eurytemora carolleeae TaxID=1294199 RepID=UPI000C78DDEE|nr:gastrula zinc finger protein xFG20-1 [Eurytemora carolleeae]|eukprot:XP_023342322.1 gastrula zinc finger protein xFG20-1-like [Eurytemora affinis]
METDSKHSQAEHAKFLIWNINENLRNPTTEKDTIVQCEDGSLPLPSLLLGGLSPLLHSALQNQPVQEDQVVILPDIQLGEILLFLKYLLSVNIKNFFSAEDVSTISKVGKYLEVDSSATPTLEIHKEIIKSKKVIKETAERAASDKEWKEEEKKKLAIERDCPFCDSRINVTIMAKHMKQKHPELEYACMDCQENLHTRSDLEVHVQLHPESPWFRTCRLCEFVCLSNYQLSSHRRSHTAAEFGSKKCQFCDKTFIKESALQLHEAHHEAGKFNKTFSCVQCSKSFSKQSNLARHIRSHFGIKSFFCDQCNAEFVDSTRLKEHSWIHLDYAKFKCPIPECDQTFRHRSNLKNHMSSHHNEPKKYPCNLCNKSFAFEYKLRNHSRWHKLEEESKKKEKIEETVTEFKDSSVYVCGSCSREFISIDDFGIHCKEYHNQSISDLKTRKRRHGASEVENQEPNSALPNINFSTSSGQLSLSVLENPQGIMPCIEVGPDMPCLSLTSGNMPNLELGPDQSKSMELDHHIDLDPETKKHLQTLDNIRSLIHINSFVLIIKIIHILNTHIYFH